MTLGIVYKIHSPVETITEIYVGSTKDFKKRESSHKLNTINPEYDNYSLRVYEYIRANGGWENFQMDPIESIEFQDVKELRSREGYWVRELKASLNCCIPGRTDAEWRDDNKETIRAKKHEYAIANSAAIVEKVRQWRLKDPIATKAKRHAEYEKYKDRMAVLSKQDRLNNPEKHQARSLKYRTEHAEEIKAKKSVVVICECGIQSTVGTLPRHRRTSKHQSLMAAKTIAQPDIVAPTNDDQQSRAQTIQQVSEVTDRGPGPESP